MEDFTPKLRCGVWLFPVFYGFGGLKSFDASCNWKLLIVTAIMGGSLIIFSPVDSQKRRLEKQQKEQYRKVVCEFVMFFLILIFILWKLNTQKYAVSIAVGIWLSAGLQIPCLIKQLTLVKNGKKILFQL